MVDTLWYDSATDLATAKLELKITDSADDTLIDDYGLKANRKIDNLVFAILDSIPTVVAAEITNELKQAAILEIARRYKIIHKNFEAAKEYENDFDDIIESVKIRAKATPTNRTELFAASRDYDTETEIFSQTIRWNISLLALFQNSFMPIRSIYAKPTGAKAQNVDWITDATPIREDGELIIQVSITSAVKLQVTLDGTSYDYINNGDAFVANVLHRYKIDVDNTMTFNIRTDDAAGVTIGKCLIKETPVVHTPWG